MRKIISLMIIILVLTACTSSKRITLENKYYNTDSSLIEIDQDKLLELEKSKENFIVFVYLPNCITSYNFNNLLMEFLNKNQMSFYKISSTEVDSTKISEKIKYYPSLVIYQDGKIIAYLDANDDEEIKYFEDIDELSAWIYKYVNFNYQKDENTNNLNEKDKDNSHDDIEEDDKTSTGTSLINRNIRIEDIAIDNNKLNIYFFWGNGCPHCEEEFAFFESIYEEYQNSLNLYPLEVWYNKDNADLLKEIAKIANIDVKGVPFTIVGNQIFQGFSSKIKTDILKAIQDEINKSEKIDYYKKFIDSNTIN